MIYLNDQAKALNGCRVASLPRKILDADRGMPIHRQARKLVKLSEDILHCLDAKIVVDMRGARLPPLGDPARVCTLHRNPGGEACELVVQSESPLFEVGLAVMFKTSLFGRAPPVEAAAGRAGGGV